MVRSDTSASGTLQNGSILRWTCTCKHPTAYYRYFVWFLLVHDSLITSISQLLELVDRMSRSCLGNVSINPIFANPNEYSLVNERYVHLDGKAVSFGAIGVATACNVTGSDDPWILFMPLAPFRDALACLLAKVKNDQFTEWLTREGDVMMRPVSESPYRVSLLLSPLLVFSLPSETSRV